MAFGESRFVARMIDARALSIPAILYSWVVIWTQFDPFAVDLAGHLSSATFFLRGYFHRFNDAQFLGYIHGLFYPPGEDIVLGGFLATGSLVGIRPVAIFQVYLSVLAMAFWWSASALASVVRTGAGRWAFLGPLAILYVSETRNTYLQGLRLTELSHTGLSSECLAAVALFLLLRELLRGRRLHRTALLLAACVLTHLVVGVVAVVILLAWTVSLGFGARRRRVVHVLLAMAWAAAASAWFWLPFIAHGGESIRNQVVPTRAPWVPLAVALVGLAVARRWAHAWLFATGVVLTAPTVWARVAHALGSAPPLRWHFYRFDVLGVVSTLFALALVIGAPRGRKRSSWRWRWAPAVGLLILIADFAGPPRRGEAAELELEGYEPWPTSRPYGRHLVREDGRRTFDFGVASYITAIDPNARIPNGLYWESSHVNHLVSSYYANLDIPDVVLDFYLFKDMSCPLIAHLFDYFVADFNVLRWSQADVPPVPSRVRLEVLSRAADPAAFVERVVDSRRCVRDLWEQGGTRGFRLAPARAFRARRGAFRSAWLEPRAELSNAAVELVRPEELSAIHVRRGGGPVFGEYFRTIRQRLGSSARRFTLVEEDDLGRLRSDLAELGPTVGTGEATLEKVGKGRFVVSLPDRPVLFKIKLAPLPGLSLRDEHGRELPWYRGYPHVVSIGSGRVRVTYERTVWMRAGYLVSGVALLMAVVLAVLGSQRSRRGS